MTRRESAVIRRNASVELVDTAITNMQTYLLVLARIGGVFGFAPVFGSYNVPLQVKAGMSAALALVTFPLVQAPPTGYPGDIVSYAVCVGREILVGAIIGYVASLFMVAVQLAGQLVDIQIGFGLVNVVDPVANRQVTVMGQFQYLLAMLLFLVFNGHHMVLAGLVESYAVVPISGFTLTAKLQAGVVRLFCNTVVVAFKIAAPVTCTLLLADVVMAVLARTVPQMNVFIVGFPLKIGVGLLTLLVALPLFVLILKGMFSGLERDILALFGGVR
ncbi:MAG: flagellar type III secretion system protein FliR [Firmicutes bacterium]|nr:flagellar type III secretion system protein FliR [Bacillota bacterium]